MQDSKAPDDEARPDLALATLFAVLVETLDQKSNGLANVFRARLDDATARLAAMPALDRGALQTLAWTKILLTDDVDRGAPACVVYAKPRPRDEEALPSSEKVQLPTLDDAVRFWERLPEFERGRAAIETANGHRLTAAEAVDLARRLHRRAS